MKTATQGSSLPKDLLIVLSAQMDTYQGRDLSYAKLVQQGSMETEKLLIFVVLVVQVLSRVSVIHYVKVDAMLEPMVSWEALSALTVTLDFIVKKERVVVLFVPVENLAERKLVHVVHVQQVPLVVEGGNHVKCASLDFSLKRAHQVAQSVEEGQFQMSLKVLVLNVPRACTLVPEISIAKFAKKALILKKVRPLALRVTLANSA